VRDAMGKIEKCLTHIELLQRAYPITREIATSRT